MAALNTLRTVMRACPRARHERPGAARVVTGNRYLEAPPGRRTREWGSKPRITPNREDCTALRYSYNGVGANGDGKWLCQTVLQAGRSATARASASTRGALVGSHSFRYSLSPLGQRLMTAM